MTEIEALRRKLLGCLIGLARTCSNNPPTGQTEALLLAGLCTLDETAATPEDVRALIERVQADKTAVSPSCAYCACPCGKNDNYDVSRIERAAPEVRDAKERIIRALIALAQRGSIHQQVFDALFALAEDWNADTLNGYAERLEAL